MDNNLLDEITEAVYEELQTIDEQAVGVGILLSVKGKVRRQTNTADITKATNSEDRQKEIEKATEVFKVLKKQLDSKQIEHDRFKDLSDEEKVTALEYLKMRLTMLKTLIDAKFGDEEKVDTEVEREEQKDDTPTDPKEIAKIEPSEEQLEAIFKILDLEKLKSAKEIADFLKSSGLLPGKEQQNEVINPKMKKPRQMAVFGLKALAFIINKKYNNLPNALSLLGSFAELTKNEKFKKQIKDLIKQKATEDEEFSKVVRSFIEKKKLDDDVVEYFELSVEAKPDQKGEESDPEEYDVSDEDRQELMDAYDQFKDEFYNKKFLKDQGILVKNLVDILNRIDKGEEREAALIGQRTQLPEVAGAAANMGKVYAPLVYEVEPSDEETEPGKVKADAKDLDNLKADVRSFAQNLVGAKKLIEQLAQAIAGGKKVAAVFKNQVTDVITKVQRHSSLLHADLTSLVAQPAKKEEKPVNEDAMDDLVARTTKMQDVYNNTVTVLNKIVPRMVDDKKSVKYDELTKTVKEALKFLEEILDVFPNVKAFAGEEGDIEKIKQQFELARKELDFDISNIQTLVKGGAVATASIENLADRISKFSKELERIFGIDSEIGKDQKPAAGADDDTEADEATTSETLNSPFDLQKYYDRRLSINPSVKMRMGELTGDGEVDEKIIRTFLIHYIFLSNAEEDSLNEVQKAAFGEISGLDQDLIVRYYQKLKSAGKESISDFIEQADRTQLQKLITAVNDYMSKKASVKIGTSLTLTKLINYDFDDPSGMGGAGKRFYADLADDQKAAFENFIKLLTPGSVNEADAKNQQEMGQILGVTPEAYEKAFLKLSSDEQRHVANVLVDDNKLKLFVDVMKFKLGSSISPGKGKKKEPKSKMDPGKIRGKPSKAAQRMRSRSRRVTPKMPFRGSMGEEIARKLEPIVREIVRGNNG